MPNGVGTQAVLNIILRAQDQTGKAFKGAGGAVSRFGQILTRVGKVAILGAVAGIGALTVGIGKLAVSAAALEPVRESFARLAKDAGTSAQDMLASMREASQGMITDAKLMENANKAMLLIGKDVAEDLPQMLKIAQVAGRAMGQDMDYMFQSLVTGIGRSSKLIIDNLGITMDVTKANEKYAAVLGKTVSELTDAEKKQAFMNEAMLAGEDMISRLGESTGGAQATMAQLRTQFSNITIEIGSAFIPILQAVLEPLAQLAQKYGPQVVEWAKKFAVRLQELMATGGKQLLEWLKSVAGWIQPIIQAFQQGGVSAALQTLLQQIADLVQEFTPRLVSLLKDWGQQFIDWIIPRIPSMLTKLGELAGKVRDWIGEQIPVITAKLSEWGTELIAWVGPQIPPLLAKLKELAEKVWDWLVQTGVPALKEKLGQWAEAFVTWLEEENVPGRLIEGLGELIGNVVEWILANGIPLVVSAISKLAKAIVNAFKEGEAGEPSLVSRILKYIATKLLPAIVRGLISVGKGLVSGLMKGIRSAFPDLAEFLRDMGTEIVKAFKKMLRIPAGSTSAVFTEIGASMRQGLLQGFGGDFGDLIPSFQAGGLVPGLGPKLAIVHGGETIMPAGRGRDIVVPVYLDGREIARVISPYLGEEYRRERGLRV